MATPYSLDLRARILKDYDNPTILKKSKGGIGLAYSLMISLPSSSSLERIRNWS